MKNSTWQIPQTLLQLLHFSQEDIQKACADLDAVVQAEVVAAFLAGLTDADRQELTQNVGTLQGRQAVEVVETYLASKVTREEITAKMQEKTNEVTKEYVAHILSTVTSQQVKDQLVVALRQQGFTLG